MQPIRVHVQCFITVVLVCTLLFIHAKEVSKSSLVENDTSQNAMHLNLLYVQAVTICSNLCTKMADNTTRWLTVLITPRRDVVKSRDTIKYSKHCWCETSHGHAYCLAQQSCHYLSYVSHHKMVRRRHVVKISDTIKYSQRNHQNMASYRTLRRVHVSNRQEPVIP